MDNYSYEKGKNRWKWLIEGKNVKYLGKLDFKKGNLMFHLQLLFNKEMFTDQVVKLEENRASPFCQSNNKPGPFQLTRTTSDKLESFEKNCHWSIAENAKYAAFIEANAHKMEGRPHAKLWTLYHQMEKNVKSRNFRQCKSHHQKMLNQHSSIPQIISSLLKSSPAFLTLLEKEREVMASKGECKKPFEHVPMFIGEKYDDKNLPATGTAYENPVDETDFGMKSDRMFNSFASLVPSGFQGLSHGKKSSHYEEEWKECHKLFLEWTGRLNNLMRPSFGL